MRKTLNSMKILEKKKKRITYPCRVRFVVQNRDLQQMNFWKNFGIREMFFSFLKKNSEHLQKGPFK